MKTSIIQLQHDDLLNKTQRIEKVCSIIDTLDTELIILPELWNTGFFSFRDYYDNSEGENGITISALSEKAKKKSCYICTGSIIEKDGEDYFNTSFLLDPDGKTIAKYRKIHLFGDEARFLKRGNKVTACETDFGVVGLSICYDLRFPELYRKLTKKGAQILLNSSAWPAERLEHWRMIIPVRALENQAVAVFCACAGENHGIRFTGHSMAINSDGTIIQEAPANGEALTFDIDMEKNMLFRKIFPVLKDRVIF